MQAPVDSTLQRLLQESVFVGIGLILAVAVLTWLIVRIRSWFREDEDPADDIHERLIQTREMHLEGHLSDAEFRSIQRRLGEQLDRSAADDQRLPSASRQLDHRERPDSPV